MKKILLYLFCFNLISSDNSEKRTLVPTLLHLAVRKIASDSELSTKVSGLPDELAELVFKSLPEDSFLKFLSGLTFDKKELKTTDLQLKPLRPKILLLQNSDKNFIIYDEKSLLVFDPEKKKVVAKKDIENLTSAILFDSKNIAYTTHDPNNSYNDNIVKMCNLENGKVSLSLSCNCEFIIDLKKVGDTVYGIGVNGNNMSQYTFKLCCWSLNIDNPNPISILDIDRKNIFDFSKKLLVSPDILLLYRGSCISSLDLKKSTEFNFVPFSFKSNGDEYPHISLRYIVSPDSRHVCILNSSDEVEVLEGNDQTNGTCFCEKFLDLKEISRYKKQISTLAVYNDKIFITVSKSTLLENSEVAFWSFDTGEKISSFKLNFTPIQIKVLKNNQILFFANNKFYYLDVSNFIPKRLIKSIDYQEESGHSLKITSNGYEKLIKLSKNIPIENSQADGAGCIIQ